MSENVHFKVYQTRTLYKIYTNHKFCLIITGTCWSSFGRTSCSQLILGRSRRCLQVLRSNYDWSTPQRYSSWSQGQLDLQSCSQTPWITWTYLSRQELTWHRKRLQIFPNYRRITSCSLAQKESHPHASLPLKLMRFYVFVVPEYCIRCEYVLNYGLKGNKGWQIHWKNMKRSNKFYLFSPLAQWNKNWSNFMILFI